MYQPDFRPFMTATASVMAGSANNSVWDGFVLDMTPSGAVLPAPNSQSLDQVSLSDTGDLAEAQGWFSNSRNNMTNLATIVEDSTPHCSRNPKSSKMLNDAVSPRRSSQLYVSRTEFMREIRGCTEKINKLQESVRGVQTKLQTVTINHEELSRWTVDMEGAMSELARQLVEKIGLPMAEEDEWHMPEEGQLHH